YCWGYFRNFANFPPRSSDSRFRLCRCQPYLPTYVKLCQTNHEEDPSGISYLIGDIHWSKAMHRAWNEIRGMEEVRMSLDFHECGVLLFKEGLGKQHYVLSY